MGRTRISCTASWGGSPRARILEGRFNVVQMAIAVPKGRDPAGMELLAHFLAQAKRDGTVARAIERAGLRGVHVAPE
jgi:polar amino acid transport system substrate-binding protein